MLPILAESAPHRGRAIGLAAVLAVVTAVAALAMRPAPSHHRHHPLHLHRGKCMSGSYIYLVR
ncbi:MAG TPA: hypothetical protein VF469_30625 [Kofleriaceae bacterium]